MKNNNLVYIGVLIVVVISGIYFYLNTQLENKKMMPSSNAKNDLMKPTEEVMKKTKEKTMMTSTTNNRYIPYSTDAFNKTSNSKRILFFYANWCPTCIPDDKSFEQNMSLIPENVTLIRVNYNDTDTDQDEKSLASKYGVTYQHTFVQIDSMGKEVAKWNGGQIEDLLKNIK
jgi:thiol-disulfide isomerase/thioredoxin